MPFTFFRVPQLTIVSGTRKRSADNVDNPRMLRKSVNDSVSSPNDAKTGKLNGASLPLSFAPFADCLL